MTAGWSESSTRLAEDRTPPPKRSRCCGNNGYSDSEIFDHFAVVNHSTFNTLRATETAAQNITFPFTIRIDDQNGTITPVLRARSGPSDCTLVPELSCFPPRDVDPTCTSPTFATAWSAASYGGVAVTGIPNHKAVRDNSDSGEASFASQPDWIDFYWNTRNSTASAAAPGNLSSSCNTLVTETQCIEYPDYSTAQMDLDLNCNPAPPLQPGAPGLPPIPPPAPPGI